MTQNSRYMLSLQHKCKGISQDELLSMANDVDPDIGALLFYSFMQRASFEAIEAYEARMGEIVPVSRRVFYRRRKQYIHDIEQRLAAAGRA